MFERFTERARRAIFFARYEASVQPTSYIESEHLLLGILRELPALAKRVPVEQLRARIAEKIPRQGTAIATTVDMPLSSEAKRALSAGAKEADRLGHRSIKCGHLVLGLIQESAFVAGLLHDCGMGPTAIEAMLDAEPATGEPPRPSVHFESIEPHLQARLVVRRLLVLAGHAEVQLYRFAELDAEALVGKKRWSRKAALGHLIDCATTHLHWIARVLTEARPVFPGPPQDEWIAAMGYKTFSWRDMVPLWVSLNSLLAHTVAGIPEDKLALTCRIGIEPPSSLEALIERYVAHSEDVIGEIVSLGHAGTGKSAK